MTETGGPKLRVRSTILLVIVALVSAAAAVSWYSGMVRARLQAVMLEGSGGSSDSDTRVTTIRFGIRNEAWTPVTIAGAGRSSSFMRLLRVKGTRTPITLGPGDTADFEFVYKVTNCSAISTQEWPIPVRVERPWGMQTVYVEPPLQEPNLSEDSEYSEDFEDEDENLAWSPWHVARASYVCDWQH
ncbi:hypothetical protein [Microtetraspora malaysiensis]|uniref:hypothetical protein n=1 Tax=Microtetraspora malaysiensis TaxID=161358 RepID=UPI00082DDEC1|nr:hypothetical protein [Microtetraspora malaysiensis]